MLFPIDTQWVQKNVWKWPRPFKVELSNARNTTELEQQNFAGGELVGKWA